MFKKTKRRIVFAIVSSLLVLMTVTLTVIYFSNRSALRRENEEMLATYAARYSLDAQPKEQDKPSNKPSKKPDADKKQQSKPPELPDKKEQEKNEPAFRLSTFYSVAYSADGTVLSVNNGNNDLQSEEALIENLASETVKYYLSKRSS